MKSLIVLLVINYMVVFCSGSQGYEKIIQKVCGMVKKQIHDEDVSQEEREDILNQIRDRLEKTAKSLDLGDSSHIQLILSGVSLLADKENYKKLCNTDNNNVLIETSTVLGNSTEGGAMTTVATTLEAGNKSKPDRAGSIIAKMDAVVKKAINNTSTIDEKIKKVEIVKEQILKSFKREAGKENRLSNRTEELAGIISAGIDATLQRLLANDSRRTPPQQQRQNAVNDTRLKPLQQQQPKQEVFRSHDEVQDDYSDAIGNEALANVTVAVTERVKQRISVTTPSGAGLTKPYECRDVVTNTCADLKGLDTFKCEYDGTTLTTLQVCDGSLDCPDGSDEKNCVQQVISKVHGATEIMAKVELNRYCFKSLVDNALLSRQGILLSSILNSQVNFLKKYENARRSGNTKTSFDEFPAQSIEQIVKEVAVVVRTFSMALTSAICIAQDISNNNIIETDLNTPLKDDGEEEFQRIMADAAWSPGECKCDGAYCKNKTCTAGCKRFCYETNALVTFGCKSLVKGQDSISLDMVCDGKLDCFEEADEAGCVASGLSKFEGSKIFDEVINMVKAKILTREYEHVRNMLIELENNLMDLLKRSTVPRVNVEVFKPIRNACFQSLKNIYSEMLSKWVQPREATPIYDFLLKVNERLIAALKSTHTGNNKVSTDDCFCRDAECGASQCTKHCIRMCHVKFALTNYACSNSSGNFAVPVETICNGKINCPTAEDEMNCSPEVCRFHHMKVLRQNILSVGEKYKGTILGDALDAWKTKVTASLATLEDRQRMTPKMLKTTAARILNDLTLTYMALETNYRRLDTEQILKKFTRLSQRIIDSLKTCTK